MLYHSLRLKQVFSALPESDLTVLNLSDVKNYQAMHIRFQYHKIRDMLPTLFANFEHQ